MCSPQRVLLVHYWNRGNGSARHNTLQLSLPNSRGNPHLWPHPYILLHVYPAKEFAVFQTLFAFATTIDGIEKMESPLTQRQTWHSVGSLHGTHMGKICTAKVWTATVDFELNCRIQLNCMLYKGMGATLAIRIARRWSNNWRRAMSFHCPIRSTELVSERFLNLENAN